MNKKKKKQYKIRPAIQPATVQHSNLEPQHAINKKIMLLLKLMLLLLRCDVLLLLMMMKMRRKVKEKWQEGRGKSSFLYV